MTKNPGKYDDLCTNVRVEAKAAGAIVIVFAGARGHGFSVQVNKHLIPHIPDLLRHIAKDIEEDLKKNTNEEHDSGGNPTAG